MKSSVKVLGTSIGISISIILGFILYGEFTRPVGFVSNEGVWEIGNGLSDGSILTYKIEIQNKSMIADLRFNRIDNNWLSSIQVNNVTHDIIFTNNLIPTDIPEDFNEWNDLRSSLFWIIDYVYEPKPLVGNSIWSSITYGIKTYELKIVAKESISIESGEFEAYKVAYYLGYQGGGEFWIVKNMPLPVKAQVFDTDNNLIFRYELLSYDL